MPAGPMIQGSGVLNLRGASGARRQGHEAGKRADDDGGEQGDPHRGAAGRDPRQIGRDQPVARHDEEDSALPVEEGKDHRRQRDHRGNGEILRRPGLADLAQDQGQRLGTVGEAGKGQGSDRRAGDGRGRRA